MKGIDSGFDPHVLVRSLRDAVDASVGAIELPGEPASLYDPIRYVLSGGGKRLRPVLVLLAGQMFGARREQVMPAALAIEVFHNFTLVHDDIMDQSDTRRGKDAVHVRWDEPTAILAGDFLMALSYRLLAQLPATHLADVHHVFDQMVIRLCEGQALDKEYESTARISPEQYLEMVDAKTGALLEAALEIGAVCGNASNRDRFSLREAGRHLGRAFQIQDDLLDLVASDERWGKAVGADVVVGKKTFLLVSALESASSPSQTLFEAVADQRGLSFDDVPRVRQAMSDAGVLDAARAAVTGYTEAAHTLVQSAGTDTPARQALIDLITRMQARLH